MIRKILIGLAVLAAILLVLILRQPDTFTLSRSTRISAPPSAVFARVNDFRKWEEWSPWAKLDPNSTATFEGAGSGEGAVFKWAGNREVGEGRQEIVESRPDERVRIRIDFIKPFEGSNEVAFTFQPEGEDTLVTWSMGGSNNFIGKCVSLIMDCETMLGPTFEEGLANLKGVVEAAPQS